MIIYFSGTGNSRFVAEHMAKQLEDEVRAANNLIKHGRQSSLNAKKPWIFVFPVYVSTMAQVFADFIRTTEFHGNRNAYFVATCASAMGATPNACASLCKEKGFRYRGTAAIQMPQNYIALFSMMDDLECKRRQNAALSKVDEISGLIREKRIIPTRFVSPAEYTMTKFVEKIYNGPFTQTKKFYSTDKCIGCGFCVKVCPLNRINLVDAKPKWNGSCAHCMACINRCPKQAIEYGKSTIGKKRYYCR